MKTLVAYATNSGSTYLLANQVKQTLEELGHEVFITNIIELDPQELYKHEFIFFGSNSWDFEGKEGQPHHAFMQFMDVIKDHDLGGRKFALFGCGDRSYQHFCGALDVIQKFVTEHQGEVVGQPLRINQFYFNHQDEIFATTEDWVKKLPL
jgi:flavodoxin I